MARTRKKTIVKIGSLEIAKRVPVKPRPRPAVHLAEKPKAKTLKKATATVGVAGNTDYYGYSGGGEYLRKLQGQPGRAVFDEMRRSDPQVQAVLKAITLPIRQAEFSIESPADDSKNTEIAEIIQENLTEGMTITWDDTLRHTLLMLPFGFSILEKCWEARDGLFKLRKLDPRLPTSIEQWKYDKAKRRLIGPVQVDTDGEKYELPIEKLLVFTSEREGDNWEGTAILRPAYKPWFLKGNFEKINAIKHERHGVGIPKAHMPDGIAEGSEQWNETENMLESLQAHEKAYIMEPEGWDIGIWGGGQGEKGTDALPSIKYYDEMIAKAMLAMFINLGTTDTGSRALGISFIEVFLMSLQTYADYIAEVFTRFCIKEYVDFNWSVKEYPKMKASQINKLDPKVLATLANAGLIKGDFDTENAIRTELRLPEKQEEEEPTQPPVPPKPQQAPPDAEIPEEEEEQQQAEHKHGLQFADRELTKEELLVNLPNIEMMLNAATESLKAEIISMRDLQAEDIIRQLVGGRRIHQLRIILKKEMHDLLLKAYKVQIRQGVQEVTEELNNQAQGRRFDEKKPSYEGLLAYMQEDLGIKVEGAANKMSSMLATFAVEMKRKGIPTSELETEFHRRYRERVSDATWTKITAMVITRGWGDGRAIKIASESKDIEYCYYSAILDGRACEFCTAKDGHTHPADDANYATPNPDCLGECRCITIAVLKAEREVA